MGSAAEDSVVRMDELTRACAAGKVMPLLMLAAAVLWRAARLEAL